MDFRFYKRARGIKHKAAATPLYPRKPAPAAPAQQTAGSKAKQPTAEKVRLVPAASAAVAVEVGGSGGDADADVDRRAALYISRVQERLRRERVADDWRKYY